MLPATSARPPTSSSSSRHAARHQRAATHLALLVSTCCSPSARGPPPSRPPLLDITARRHTQHHGARGPDSATSQRLLAPRGPTTQTSKRMPSDLHTCGCRVRRQRSTRHSPPGQSRLARHIRRCPMPHRTGEKPDWLRAHQERQTLGLATASIRPDAYPSAVTNAPCPIRRRQAQQSPPDIVAPNTAGPGHRQSLGRSSSLVPQDSRLGGPARGHAEACSTTRSTSLRGSRRATHTSSTPTDDNEAHHPHEPNPRSRGRAIPHDLTTKMHEVSIPQRARPGPLDQAARTGSQTVVAPG